MTLNSLVQAGKFMSFVLRHKPDEIGLELDEGGWASVADLIEKSGDRLTDALVREVVAENEKRRFALSEDGLKVRALQGHSIEVDLGLAPEVPPVTLYHGTAQRFLASIREQGLVRRARHHVHLSSDIGTALKVGARHGAPIVFAVAAQAMHERGIAFYLSENGVWLTDHVPPSDLDLLSD